MKPSERTTLFDGNRMVDGLLFVPIPMSRPGLWVPAMLRQETPRRDVRDLGLKYIPTYVLAHLRAYRASKPWKHQHYTDIIPPNVLNKMWPPGAHT